VQSVEYRPVGQKVSRSKGLAPVSNGLPVLVVYFSTVWTEINLGEKVESRSGPEFFDGEGIWV
jgi:hypothetical protein